MRDKEMYFEFLYGLRGSGVTNMYGAIPYLIEEFPELTKDEAKIILSEWMETFSESAPWGW